MVEIWYIIFIMVTRQGVNGWPIRAFWCSHKLPNLQITVLSLLHMEIFMLQPVWAKEAGTLGLTCLSQLVILHSLRPTSCTTQRWANRKYDHRIYSCKSEGNTLKQMLPDDLQIRSPLLVTASMPKNKEMAYPDDARNVNSSFSSKRFPLSFCSLQEENWT